DAAVGDVAGGEADRDEEVLALAFFGDDRAIGDRIGREAADLDIAFVFHVALAIDVALDVVGVHRVGGEANGIVGGGAALAVVLSHHNIADHAAGFADIELVRPAGEVVEFVFAEAPAIDFIADFFGNARVGDERPDQTLLIAEMFLKDFFAGDVVGFRPGIAFAD